MYLKEELITLAGDFSIQTLGAMVHVLAQGTMSFRAKLIGFNADWVAVLQSSPIRLWFASYQSQVSFFSNLLGATHHGAAWHMHLSWICAVAAFIGTRLVAATQCTAHA